ncbi:unnamed protein product [Durusdinium trenchii]|uniref:Peptidyl-tRNA hydrolase n=1 Tax=Durusdinium trenchii TaxID=1381693 RepID=A0ABP0LA57_9DINO
MRQLMVGLGNPWPSPKMARHNLGTMVLEALAKQLDLEWSWWWSCWGWIAEEEELGFGFFLPRSFYNTSGWAVQRVMELHGLEAHQVLLLHDDLDLPPLCWSVLGGNHSDAGNRGVRGVRRAAGNVRRLRLGIGRPDGGDVGSYVLGKVEDELLERWQVMLIDATELTEHALELRWQPSPESC